VAGGGRLPVRDVLFCRCSSPDSGSSSSRTPSSVAGCLVVMFWSDLMVEVCHGGVLLCCAGGGG
jgi:hypothetical protein